MTKKDYLVTEKAGLFVAGKRSPGAGKSISLTADQADYALISGELSEPEKPARAAKKPAPPATPVVEE